MGSKVELGDALTLDEEEIKDVCSVGSKVELGSSFALEVQEEIKNAFSVGSKTELGDLFALEDEAIMTWVLNEVKCEPQHHAVSMSDTTVTSAPGKKHKLPASEQNPRPSKMAKEQSSSEKSCASFQAFVDTLPAWTKTSLHPSLDTAVQLRLVCGDRERTIIVSGDSTMYKLNQYISEAYDIGCGEFSSNARRGKTGDGTRFSISRPLGPGKCDDVLICGKATAKNLRKPFVDHKTLRVGHLFRGMDDGSGFLSQEPSDLNMTVTFFNFKLPRKAIVVLEGIMPNGAELPRHRNTEPLPRIVAWSSDYSISEAIEKNKKMADDRKPQSAGLSFAWTTPEMHKHADDMTRLVPLFRRDGLDYRWQGCLIVGELFPV